MKKQNIAVGDYVVSKVDGILVYVGRVNFLKGLFNGQYMVECDIEDGFVEKDLAVEVFRRPRVKDLKPGDEFKFEGRKFILTEASSQTKLAGASISGTIGYHSFSGTEKVKIISLASEEKPDLDIINEIIGPDEISVDTRERVYRTQYVNGGEFLTTHPAPGLDIIKTFVEIPTEDE